jgi:hypothetical protein
MTWPRLWARPRLPAFEHGPDPLQVVVARWYLDNHEKAGMLRQTELATGHESEEA